VTTPIPTPSFSRFPERASTGPQFLPETRIRASRPFRRPCIQTRRVLSPRPHQENRRCVRRTHGRSLCSAQGGNGISDETRSGWAQSELEPAQAREGAVPVSVRAQGTDTVIQYSDGTVEVRSGGTLTWRNNNPGNLRNYPFSQRHGSLGAAHGFAVFPDETAGRGALSDLLNTQTYQSRTLNETVASFAADASVPRYQQLVSRWTGIAGTTRLDALTTSQLGSVVSGIQRMEGWQAGRVTYGVPQ
jgi:hypothetical protein